MKIFLINGNLVNKVILHPYKMDRGNNVIRSNRAQPPAVFSPLNSTKAQHRSRVHINHHWAHEYLKVVYCILNESTKDTPGHTQLIRHINDLA